MLDHPVERVIRAIRTDEDSPMYEATFHFPDDDFTVDLPAYGIPRKGDTIMWTGPNAKNGDEYEVIDVRWVVDYQDGTKPCINITLDPVGD